ncbi:MAG: hypothetical protein KDA89_03690 [Planctomycetaceae bacterium]|nr:hypothetical protein [Planctomycetaceae bacterium]
MPKAIRTDSVNNRTTGFARPALADGQPVSVEDQVHDGDTINVRPDGDIGVRLLGIDTPEISFVFPGASFTDLSDSRWNEFLTTPFDSRWGEFNSAVPADLQQWILSKVRGQPGSDHHAHAVQATDELRSLIRADMEIMGQDLNTFSYYMNFGFEVMDGYGRFLCTINRNQPDRSRPTPRPPTYNLRLLERGRAFPYFIWPNVNPWERPDSIQKAVIPPGKARELAATDRELLMARRFVSNARSRHLGIYDSMNPLLLEPFELRFLARRELPERRLIDLTSDSNRLIAPQKYFEVSNPEDRLWIPSIYVPLFEKAGWVAG